jgi:hypothetical protein
MKMKELPEDSPLMMVLRLKHVLGMAIVLFGVYALKNVVFQSGSVAVISLIGVFATISFGWWIACREWPPNYAWGTKKVKENE